MAKNRQAPKAPRGHELARLASWRKPIGRLQLVRALLERLEAWRTANADNPSAMFELSMTDVELCIGSMEAHFEAVEEISLESRALQAALAATPTKRFEAYARARGFDLDPTARRQKHVPKWVVNTYRIALLGKNTTSIGEPLWRWLAHPEQPRRFWRLPPWPRTPEQAVQITAQLSDFKSAEACRKYLQRHCHDPDLPIPQGER